MNPIHVLLATDRRCLWGCAVAIKSLLENSSAGSDIHFHVIESGLRADDRASLRSTAESHAGGADIAFRSFDAHAVRHLQRSRAITRTAYARLFLGEILPASVERCIYVDCDVVFEQDARELWSLELGGFALAAVDNAAWDDPIRYQKRLGLTRPTYFNSGVLLIDVERWRKWDVGGRAVRFAERTGDRLILHDQDALNGALDGEWLSLDLAWNTWVIHPSLHDDARAVFHYMGTPKPWDPDYDGPFKDKFFRYLDCTPYAGARPWDPAGLGGLMRRARRRVPYLPSAARILRARLLGHVR